jgi:hypothetical protein
MFVNLSGDRLQTVKNEVLAAYMSKRGNDMLHAASGKCVLMGHL